MVPEVSLGALPTLLAPAAALVVSRRIETADVVTLALDSADGADAAPGQFSMLWVPGVGEVAVSVSGRGSGAEVLHTIKRVGAVTDALCRAEVGQVIGARGPFGQGWDLTTRPGDDLVMVAGGIGLAPLRPAINAVLERRDEFGRVVILVGARSPADVVFAEEIGGWSRRPDLEVTVTVDRASPGWRGGVGVITRLLPGLSVDPGRTTALVCGPEVMIRFAARALVDLGVAPSRLQVSLERNMRCGIGLCGHCQLGPLLLCRDGPVRRWDDVDTLLRVREL